MKIHTLDHVNIRTANLDAMVEWYGRVLDMPVGDRPPFGVPGAWLYCNNHPFIHLVGVEAVASHEDLQLEHFAFSATGRAQFLRHLEQENVAYRLSKVPKADLLQVNISDFDGNHIHIDFSTLE